MKNLIEIMSSLKGCKIAGIKYIAEVKIPKKYGIVGIVEKVVEKQVQLNYSYENAVNNRLERQGDERLFVAQSLPWGSWLKGLENKVIEHNGEYYLRVYSVNSGTKVKNDYFINGVLANDEEIKIIKEYEKSKKKVSGTQAEYGLLENQVKPSAIKFSGIIELKVGGEIYEREVAVAV